MDGRVASSQLLPSDAYLSVVTAGVLYYYIVLMISHIVSNSSTKCDDIVL